MSGLVVFAERFDFRCWKCGETYSIFKEVKLDPEKKSKQKIKIACPYCGESAIVDFFPYRSKKKIILRNANAKDGNLGYEYDLPKILPTHEIVE